MPVVVDCSVAAAWAFEDERSTWTERALETATVSRATVPPIFWYEIRNILIINERRGRINAEQIARFLKDIDSLATTDTSVIEADILALARNHKLTIYDASYLELANRLELELMALDRQLIDAAVQTGAQLWHP
jgi:predicted nucleic acid-binding protein